MANGGAAAAARRKDEEAKRPRDSRAERTEDGPSANRLECNDSSAAGSLWRARSNQRTDVGGQRAEIG